MFALPPGIPGNGDAQVGMLTTPEGACLAELAAGKTVLEMGSWCGLSTVVMARVAKSLWSADWHQGDKGMGRQNTLAAFLETLARFKAECCPVVLLVGNLAETLPVLESRTFDMVYIDAAHDHESVARDTFHALRLVRRGGVVAWHDADMPGVARVLEEEGLVANGPGRLAVATIP